MKNKNLYLVAICGVGMFTLGILLGKSFFHDNHEPTQVVDSSDRLETHYSFISPLLECDNYSQLAHAKYIPFEKKIITTLQNEVISQNPNISLSVYFRNLQNGPWFGINEDEIFSPASLLKLPVLITYLKESEKRPNLLEEKIKLTTPSQTEQNIKPEHLLEMGKEYSVKELLDRLITESDNVASENLIAYIGEEPIVRVFTDLGVPLPNEASPDGDFVTVKEYASFFRILYNATYLNKEGSEYALKILSQSKFSEGIRKPIPSIIPIAHKFGERKFNYTDGKYQVNQLHDCGIVYYQKYPYLLCVMTKGTNVDYGKLSKVIQQTSKIIYTEVTNAY